MSKQQLLAIPEGWYLIKFRDIVESIQPGFACGKRDEKGFVQLRMNNIGRQGKIVADSLLRVPKSETNIEKYVLRKGDVIFNNTNSPELVGKTVLFNDEIENCVYSNHLTRIRVNPQLTFPEFVVNFLRLEQRKGTFELLCRRFVGQAAVPRESLLNLDFPLPPINEQKRAVSKIEELFKESRAGRQALDKVPQIMKRFRQSVLANAFRGKLVPQNPNNTSVKKLLEKIRTEKKGKWEEELRTKGEDPRKFKYEEIKSIEEELEKLPNSWIWVRLDEVLEDLQYGTSDKASASKEAGIPILRMGNIQ
ncbi:MAG: restriction endonuclease subunit S, partial [Nitrosopumilaceae archaeon]